MDKTNSLLRPKLSEKNSHYSVIAVPSRIFKPISVVFLESLYYIKSIYEYIKKKNSRIPKILDNLRYQ